MYGDEDFHYSTDTEWDNAEAAQLSEEHPDWAWVITDRDVAHANPNYKGEPRCHPECGCNGEGPMPGCLTNPPLPDNRPKPVPRDNYSPEISDDDIPF